MTINTYDLFYSKLFSQNVIKDILSKEQSTDIIKMVDIFPFTVNKHGTFGDFFDDLYLYLKVNYRNEYIYKNEFLLSLLEKEYKTEHVYLQEVRIGKNIADIVVVNGKSEAYEIKTEYDSLNRLEGQLISYLKVFDKVHVVVSQKHLLKVESMLQEKFPCVGIYIFKNSKLKCYKKAGINDIADARYYKEIINLSELTKRNMTFNELCSMEYKKSAKVFREILKARQKNGNTIIEDVPESLKSLVSGMNLLKWQKEKFKQKLNCKVI